MLPTAHRMRRGTDFTVTTRHGTKASRGRVVCYLLTPGDLGDPSVLVGLIVGKSVGNSVVRHRASRRIRGCLRSVVETLPAGSRLVVRALAGADTDPRLCNDIEAAVSGALARSKGA